MASVHISSLAELEQYAQKSRNVITMEPGVYPLTDLISLEDIPARNKQEAFQFITFSGNDNVFHLNGVKIEVDTALRSALRPPIHNNEFVVSGNNNTFHGLSITYTGEGTSPAGAMLSIAGYGNTLRDCEFLVRGSFPYAYGDLFGKGGDNVINHHKQSGVHIVGSDTSLYGCRLFMRSYGHGYYIQGGHNHYFEDCYVEGKMRSTDDMLAEPSGPAYDVDFRSVYANRDGEYRVIPGYIKSLSEDGFRTYTQTENVRMRNCTAKHMRGGFELRTEGAVHIEGCTSIGNERGFWVSSNTTLINSKGDARYGPLLFVEGDGVTVDLSVMSDESDKNVHALATIHGSNHDIRLVPYQNENRKRYIPIKLAYVQPASGEGMSPYTENSATNVTLYNETMMPIDIGPQAQNCDITTNAKINQNDGKQIRMNKLNAMHNEQLHSFAPGHVRLLSSRIKNRFDLNYRYLMRLSTDNLLRNYYLEAALPNPPGKPEEWHGGWEFPTCQLSGHFLGHWLSAAAHIYAQTADGEVKEKANTIVAELRRCQLENGAGWIGPFPEKFMQRIVQGKDVWAPQYTLHKLFMGLYDMATVANNELALTIIADFAGWFHRWTAPFTQEELADILDYETGGMLEVWADMYGKTGESKYYDLLKRYDRRRLFEPLLAGEDVLTNKHANTTIPEILGAARAWEVTGEKRYWNIVQAYWDSAVTNRGMFCTGGQTCGEIWTPPYSFSARLGQNQEHCTVYNMMRLAHFLFRWTGDVRYMDYWERNFVNGILAQQHPHTGMVAYYLSLRAGSKKNWGSETDDFWCCHGTLQQAHARYDTSIFFREGDDTLVVAQYMASQASLDVGNNNITIRLVEDTQDGDDSIQKVHVHTPTHRPQHQRYQLTVSSEQPTSCTLKLRVPWWVKGEPVFSINGKPLSDVVVEDGWVVLRREWKEETLIIEFPKELTAEPLPDQPDMVAFMDGPVVLAGIVDEERMLYGDITQPKSMLTADYERFHREWLPIYRTVGQDKGWVFKPLHAVTDETYTVYFPVWPTS